MTVLLWAEHDGRCLSPAVSRAVTAARQLDLSVHILVAGVSVDAIANEAAMLAGVEKVLYAPHPAFAHNLVEPIAALLAQCGRSCQAIVAAATAQGKAIMPRVAAALNIPQISDVTAILSANRFERPVYGGSLLQTVECAGPFVITTRPVSFVPTGTQKSAPIETLAIEATPSAVRFISASFSDTDITNARVVVAGGRGVASREGFSLISALAKKMGGAVGATRAAVDAGFALNEWQIGQSGCTIAPDIYIAIGISGAIQHIAGIRDAKCIAAINKDPQAPIFRIADIGLVGDLFTEVPKLLEELKKRGIG